MPRRWHRIYPDTPLHSASPFCLIERYLTKLVQLGVTQVFDGAAQVLGQDMPPRSGFAVGDWTGSRLAKQLRQLGTIRRHAARLVAGQPVGRGAALPFIIVTLASQLVRR